MGLDELDMPFDLSEQATSSPVGGKGARVSVGSSIGATDSGADPKEEPDFEHGSLADEEGLNDLDFSRAKRKPDLGMSQRSLTKL